MAAPNPRRRDTRRRWRRRSGRRKKEQEDQKFKWTLIWTAQWALKVSNNLLANQCHLQMRIKWDRWLRCMKCKCNNWEPRWMVKIVIWWIIWKVRWNKIKEQLRGENLLLENKLTLYKINLMEVMACLSHRFMKPINLQLSKLKISLLKEMLQLITWILQAHISRVLKLRLEHGQNFKRNGVSTINQVQGVMDQETGLNFKQNGIDEDWNIEQNKWQIKRTIWEITRHQGLSESVSWLRHTYFRSHVIDNLKW